MIITSNQTHTPIGGASNSNANGALIQAGCWGTLTGLSGIGVIGHLLAGNGINTIWYLALAILAGQNTHRHLKRSNPLNACDQTVVITAKPA